MNESWSTYEWAMSHTWISHVTRMNKSCHTYEWVMSHTWISHVTHMNESCNTLQSSLFHMYSRLKSDHAVIRDMTHPYVTWRIHHVTWIFCPGGVVKTHRQQWSRGDWGRNPLCGRLRNRTQITHELQYALQKCISFKNAYSAKVPVLTLLLLVVLDGTTHSCVRHKSCICGAWLIYMWG